MIPASERGRTEVRLLKSVGKLTGAAALLAVAVWLGDARAELSVPRWGVHGAGTGFVQAGGFVLGATIGEVDAGLLVSGPFRLYGGFWIPGSAGPSGVDEGGDPGPIEEDRTPRIARILPARPNPAKTRAQFRFDLPETRPVEVRIFDIRGRLVRALLDRDLPAGRHTASWDLRTNGGWRAPTGVYLARVRLGPLSRTLQLIVLE